MELNLDRDTIKLLQEYYGKVNIDSELSEDFKNYISQIINYRKYYEVHANELTKQFG